MKTVFPRDFYRMYVQLGELFLYKPHYKTQHIVKFIKVTPKGFNFLDIETHKCILLKHCYDPSWSGKKIPNNIKQFWVWVKRTDYNKLQRIKK